MSFSRFSTSAAPAVSSSLPLHELSMRLSTSVSNPKCLFRRLAAEEDGLWSGVDEREEGVARSSAEVHTRDELLDTCRVPFVRLGTRMSGQEALQANESTSTSLASCTSSCNSVLK